jgi:hypothetical protein
MLLDGRLVILRALPECVLLNIIDAFVESI